MYFLFHFALATTFYRDVLPILDRRCLACHRSGEVGPMPLETYAQARPWAKAIREAVVKRTMPPWFAERASRPLANDPRLSADEIATIRAWVDAGAAAGDPGDRAPAISRVEGWNIPPPDLVARMPQPVPVPASGDLDYQYVVVPLGLKEDRWAQAVEVRPGVRGVVHHAVAYVREPDDPWLRDAPVGKPFARPGVTRADILAIYTPGQPPSSCRPGMARKIPAGSDLVLQMHYTPNGRAVSDRTSVGIAWAKAAPDKRVLTLQIDTTDLRIPPGEPAYRISASGTLPNDALLLSMFPHMHLRGKAFEYSLIEPDGRYELLLRVAPWRFDWQMSYVLSDPVPVKAGARIRCTAWYDNSANNAANPDPSAEVGYGEQSRDEMMAGFFDVAVPAAVDKKAFFVRSAGPR